MKNTYLRLNKSACNKLLELLDNVPDKQRDVVWHQLYPDVKAIHDIWEQIDLRNEHMVKIKKYALAKTGAKVKGKAK